MGPANADKCDVISECKRQLFDVATYKKLSAEEVKILLESCISNLRKIVETHFYKSNCSQKEKDFLLSNTYNYVIHTFTLFGKFLKQILQPIVAGYNWILTQASINL